MVPHLMPEESIVHLSNRLPKMIQEQIQVSPLTVTPLGRVKSVTRFLVKGDLDFDRKAVTVSRMSLLALSTVIVSGKTCS